MGIETLLQQNVQNAGLAGSDRLARNAMFPQAQMDKTQYAVPSQLPTSAETIRSDYEEPSNAYTGLPLQRFAQGGIASIPRYADGGLFTPYMSGMTPQNELTFDSQAYLSANPDVAQAGVDPFQHYQQYGKNEGRQFTGFSDVITRPDGSIITPGFAEEIAPPASFFEEMRNANNNPQNRTIDEFSPYAIGQPPPQNRYNFDSQAYLAANPDVAKAGVDPYSHYQNYGQREGRQGFFDTQPEIAGPAPIGIAQEIAPPASFFDELRATSNSQPPTGIAGLAPTQPQYQDQAAFNSAAYLSANPDVAAAIGKPGVGSAWEHYQNFGQREGRQATFDQQMAGWDAPTQNQSNFDAQAYLAANQDVARSGLDPYQHYIKYGQQEGRQATFNPVTAADPSQWEQRTYGVDPNMEGSGSTYYVDPATGNAYTVNAVADPYTGESSLDFSNAKRVASGAALNDYFLDAAGLTADPAKAQELYSKKEKDPHAYYSSVADKLQNTIYQGYWSNRNTDQQINALDKIKDLDPVAYYENKIKALGHNIGWNIGQNTPDRNTPKFEEIQRLAPEALKAGLTPQQINDLINQTASEAAGANQQRIANEKAAGQGMLNGLPQFAGNIALMALAPQLAPYLSTLGPVGAAAASGAIMGGAGGALNSAISGKSFGENILKGAAIGGISGAVVGGISDVFNNIPTETTQAMVDYANSTPDPILALTELQGMSASDLAATLGTKVTPSIAEKIASKLASTAAKTELAKLFAGSGGSAVARASGANQGIAGGTGGEQGIAGATGSGGSSQGIASGASSSFNPNITTSGLGIGTPAASPYAVASQPLFLSKLSDFKYDAPEEFAAGGMAYGGGIGSLGSYSDGGRLLKGPGDGMSDHIPATIGAKQPARLAEGEFVIPADVVSHLGNGSTDAGAKQLYKMMNNIRRARTGNPKQGKRINPDKFTPKG